MLAMIKTISSGLLMLSLVILILIGCVADQGGPTAVLARIYTLPNPNFDAFHDRKLRHDYYTPDAIAVIEDAERCFKKSFDMDHLDFDYIVPGNDYSLSNLQMVERMNDGHSAHVEVRFMNGDDPVRMDFFLKRIEESWLIDDVAYDDSRLSESPGPNC